MPVAVASGTLNEGQASVAVQKDINFVFHSECPRYQTGIKQLGNKGISVSLSVALFQPISTISSKIYAIE